MTPAGVFTLSTDTFSNTSPVAGLGDIDGDGLSDIAIGDPFNSLNADGAGALHILLGGGALSAGGGELNMEDAEASIYGDTRAQYSGYKLDGAGDVDGDGLDDVLIGIGGLSSASYVFLGPLTGELDIQDADAYFSGFSDKQAGHAVSSAGDTNNDGYDDILIGAPNDHSGTGAAFLFRGPLPAHLPFSDADATLVGEDFDHYAGRAVSGAGDIDDDGGSDLLIGAPEAYDSAGRAYLVSGATTGTLDLADAEAIFSGNSGSRLGPSFRTPLFRFED